MATTTTGNRGRLGTPDWVRWGFVVFPMLISIPYFAHWWSWVLFGIAIVASAPLLRATPESKPRWVLPVAMPVVVAASATLWVLQPNSWVSVAMFSTTFYTLRVFGKLLSAVVLLTTAAAIVAWVVLRQLDWLKALALFAILAVMVLLAASRRDRAARLEQTELALARAQTAAEEHARAAALAERARIAREVHDVLAHSLAGLALNLQGARLMLVRDGASPEAVAQIERAQKLASDGLSEARKAVAALREDAVPVERAVADLLAAYRLDTGARADLVVAGEPRELDAAVNTTLVRAVQEALANTRKHAPGAAVDITLAFGREQVDLTVLDRQGRRPPDAPAAGYGLRGMGERVALLEGKLESGPGEDGWRIHLTVPA
ncbi:sensor histidine kinase [Amycolatopsis sp. NPDC051903]|uniref:sensor histidine kinase n=1 Tax=Amycolatopsis sp. NPDC051903 TaxID=3363936 RepID=UPI0037B7595E